VADPAARPPRSKELTVSSPLASAPPEGLDPLDALTAEELDDDAIAQLDWAATIYEFEERRAAEAAYDLHDGAAQTMIWCRDMLRMVERRHEIPELTQIREVVEATLGELREVIERLRGAHEAAGPSLATLLHTEVERFVARQAALGSPIDVVLELASPLPPMPDATAQSAFRIAQESLTNAARHGRATRVLIAIREIPDGLGIVVEDDGVGFRADARPPVRRRPRLGLAGMGSRARRLGGDLEVQRGPTGTTVYATLPLAPSCTR
jgi:signal transduction histidine kinase